jgi:hypothetical protein
MMSSGLALLFATLIGVFITPDGIVIGADTALSNLGGHVASQQKYCITGPRSVATMQGAYWLRDRVTEATVELHNRFRELCSQVGDSLSPMTLREQADRIANALRTDLTTFLEGLPPADVVAIYSSSPVVARVAVSGYGERGPASVVVGLGVAIDRATNRWEVQVQPLSRLTFSECGVRFHGQESVVTVLRTDKGVRIPKAELQHTDVARLAELSRGNCDGASVQSASAMFVQAVRLTVTLGGGFGVPKGAVSPPIDVVVIPREGSINVTQIASW